MKKFLLYTAIVLVGITGAMATFPDKTAELGIGAERWLSGLTSKTLIVNAETWHYLQGGPEDGEVVLLVHGFGGDKDNWTRFSRYLTDRYRVIALDLPGFGESSRKPAWDYSLQEQQNRVHDFVQTLGLERFHLVGNSMGGNLAALYVYAYPEDVLTLGLFNNSGILAPTENEFQRVVAKGENPLVVNSVDDFDRFLAFVSYKEPFVPWPVKGVIAKRALEHAEFNKSIFATLKKDDPSNLAPILPQLEVPTLILWGENDRVLDVSIVNVMQSLMPKAVTVVMKNTGHVPMIERPKETATHYLEFIDRALVPPAR